MDFCFVLEISKMKTAFFVICPKLIVHLSARSRTRVLFIFLHPQNEKAGGLCLALKGVPVKPTDDVDVDKEYRLIPLDSL